MLVQNFHVKSRYHHAQSLLFIIVNACARRLGSRAGVGGGGGRGLSHKISHGEKGWLVPDASRQEAEANLCMYAICMYTV